MRRLRFTGVTLSVLVLMVAPIAACGGSSTGGGGISQCNTQSAFKGGGRFDATSISTTRTHPDLLPSGNIDSGHAVVSYSVTMTLSQPPTPTSNTTTESSHVEGALLTQHTGSGTFDGGLTKDVSSSLCSGTVTASCKQGDMVGGGYSIDAGAGAAGILRVVASYPSNTGWTVNVLNGTSTSHKVTAYAACTIYEPSGTPTPVPTPTSGDGNLGLTVPSPMSMLIGAKDSKTVTTSCPSGMVAIGGGFRLTPQSPATPESSAYITSSQPTADGTGWTVGAHADSTATDGITAFAYAVCAMNLTSVSNLTKPVSFTVSNGSAQGTNSCSSGGMTGGGFTISNPDTYETLFVQTDGPVSADGVSFKQWGVTAFNNGSESATPSVSPSFEVDAVCMK